MARLRARVNINSKKLKKCLLKEKGNRTKSTKPENCPEQKVLNWKIFPKKGKK